MMKRLIAFFMAIFAVFAFSGCGNDLSGTYVGEPLGQNEPQTVVMDVKKADKGGYTIAMYKATYKLNIDVQNKDKARYANPAAAFFTGKPVKIDEEHMPRYGGTGKFSYKLDVQLHASEPSKQNIMTAIVPGSFGMGQANFEIDKDGNIIDTNGVSTSGYLVTEPRKFVKVMNFNKDSIKEDLQKRIIVDCERQYNGENQRFGTIEFSD